MRGIHRNPVAAAVSAALLASAAPAAQAVMIQYSLEGEITSQGAPVSGYTGETYSVSFVFDTVAGQVGDFSWSVTNHGTWTGSGGYLSVGSNSFFVDLGTQYGGASYTQLGDASVPVTLGYHSIRVSDPNLFGGYVDGFPTTFDLSATPRTYFLFGASSSSNFFAGAFTSASGAVIQSVPEPPTAAAVLAGLAALGTLRRRKRAA